MPPAPSSKQTATRAQLLDRPQLIEHLLGGSEMCVTYGPAELRIRWEPDPEPIDPGDIPLEEWAPYIRAYGVDGCTVEIRRPACGCCGVRQWEFAASLWGIVGDADYHREIERELISEASRVLRVAR